MSEIINKALNFAVKAHDGQMRKHSDEQYIEHPIRVAGTLSELGLDEETVAVALLHDTLEDCEDVTLLLLIEEFGKSIACSVDGCSARSIQFPELSRNQRKAMDAEWYISGDVRVHNVKMADMIDNCYDMLNQPGFSDEFVKTYMIEKTYLAQMLDKADDRLYLIFFRSVINHHRYRRLMGE